MKKIFIFLFIFTLIGCNKVDKFEKYAENEVIERIEKTFVHSGELKYILTEKYEISNNADENILIYIYKIYITDFSLATENTIIVRISLINNEIETIKSYLPR